MNETKVREAVKAAEAFIKRARVVLDRAKEDKLLFISGSRSTGALKRSSMELSQALVELRKTS